MGTYSYTSYVSWKNVDDVPIDTRFILLDHLNGFDKQFRNPVLDLLQQKFKSVDVVWHNIFTDEVVQNYPNLHFQFSALQQESKNFSYYGAAPLLKQKTQLNNFLCSFNGSYHTSRALLTAALYKFGWFSENTTKNFVIDSDALSGFIMETCGAEERLYHKFFTTDQQFYDSTYAQDYNEVNKFDHLRNIPRLESILKRSFVHVVSESLATSYQPFVTEKILYSILSKGLWVAYGAPNYHQHIERYYGFRKFSIFNYSFDQIQDPVKRLVELLNSLAKFSKLTIDEWNDLYAMEKDTLKFNYDHYLSKDYLKVLKNYDTA